MSASGGEDFETTLDAPGELAALRAYLATMPSPARVREPTPAPRVPFEPLPPLDATARRAIEGAALEANGATSRRSSRPTRSAPSRRAGAHRG